MIMIATDTQHRCPWVDMNKPDYITYHDQEWGVPVHDDEKMFEFLILEGMQAGLNWYTILKKREHFREAFADFNAEKMAGFGDKEIAKLMQNKGIIRNQLKIAAAITNAQQYLRLMEREGGFAQFLWQFVEGKTINNKIQDMTDYPTTSEQAQAMSHTLKKLGFKFVGPTICYAHMQATGMVNDHVVDCFRYQEVAR